MRITISIDDESGEAPRTEVSAQDVTLSSPDTTAPPRELAARAQALGAISAGPAPSGQEAPGTPGAPAITPRHADETVGALTGAEGSEDETAGAAPGRPDERQGVNER